MRPLTLEMSTTVKKVKTSISFLKQKVLLRRLMVDEILIRIEIVNHHIVIQNVAGVNPFAIIQGKFEIVVIKEVILKRKTPLIRNLINNEKQITK